MQSLVPGPLLRKMYRRTRSSPAFRHEFFAVSDRRMNLATAIQLAVKRLGASGVAERRREAASLLKFVLEKDSSFLIAHPEYELTEGEQEYFENVVDRRAHREPFQYITGRQEFFGLEFEVTPDVLIPRPETEVLVEAAIDLLKGREDARLCEIGVGSGCISISILNTL